MKRKNYSTTRYSFDSQCELQTSSRFNFKNLSTKGESNLGGNLMLKLAEIVDVLENKLDEKTRPMRLASS